MVKAIPLTKLKLVVSLKYTYDSWGKGISITGTKADTVGKLNPYRYRGYRYDEETGFYYLQSRYYNPEWGRFINADGLTSTGQGVIGNNMFAYCLNNPVNMSDEYGCIPSSFYMSDGGGNNSNNSSVLKQIKETIEAVTTSFYFEAGVGQGLGASVSGTVYGQEVSASLLVKDDIIHYTGAEGKNDLGELTLFSAGYNLGPITGGKEEGLWHSSIYNTDKCNCSLEKMRKGDMSLCPAIEHISSTSTYNFEIGGEVYLLLGVCLKGGFNTENFIGEWKKIWDGN